MATSSSIVVVKIGGSTLGGQDTSLADVASLQREGVQPVVVHGGGSTITEWMAKMGVRAEFVDGLRVTDEASLEVVSAVLAGLINKQLVVTLQGMGAQVVGLSGADAGLLQGSADDPRLGFVADTVEVDARPLQLLIAGGYIPVVAPLAVQRPGTDVSAYHLLNVNADTAAGAIAVALGAAQLVFLTDVDGVLDTSGRLIPRISSQQGYDLLTSGAIKGGMIPKLKASLYAASQGTSSCLINGTRTSALLEGVRGKGSRTLVV